MVDRAADLLKWHERALKEADKTKKQLTAQIEAKEQSITKYADAIALADVCIQRQADVKKHIETLASALLTHVFQEPIKFMLEQVTDSDGNLTGLTPMIVEEGVARPYAKQGGGATNLMSFAIRIACLLLKPELSPVLFLDEPNVNMDVDKQERLVEFLLDLVNHHPLQIIAVTHGQHVFQEVYRFSKTGGKTKIKKVS